MNVHFIAIGGSVMHNLAICLRNKSYKVTGSDDEIFEPALSRLKEHGLLPGKFGWFPEKITSELDAVILGMHARPDNPELIKAQELGVRIYSFPEYVYEQIKDKKRVVIGGSHGKTTITSMIMHVLRLYSVSFDYLVGSKLQGFDLMVNLSENAPVAILEGDEYLSSPIDRTPKFLFYKPHIALLSGIAWDHINVFPTFDIYQDQFRQFVDSIEENGSLIFYEGDENLSKIAKEHSKPLNLIPYSTPSFRIENGVTFLENSDNPVALQIFGKHNLQNLEGARHVCSLLGISDSDFYKAMESFTGAARRMELLVRNERGALFKDFAHSPSKLKATVSALKEQFPERKLVACMELHTFSSLNKTFLNQYERCMDKADVPIVYFNRHTIEMKKLPAITPEEIRKAFTNENLTVFTEVKNLLKFLNSQNWDNTNLLMMSSGNFDGVEWEKLKSLFTR